MVAMMYCTGDMQERHSEIVLKEGTLYENDRAMGTATDPAMVQRHRKRFNELKHVIDVIDQKPN